MSALPGEASVPCRGPQALQVTAGFDGIQGSGSNAQAPVDSSPDLAWWRWGESPECDSVTYGGAADYAEAVQIRLLSQLH